MARVVSEHQTLTPTTAPRRGESRISAGTLQRRITIANRLLIGIWTLPLLILAIRQLTGSLGPNPVDTITASTGTWALRLLWLSLLITPLRRLTGWQWLIRLRRTPALFSFFYACLHAMTYWLFEHELAVTAGFLSIISHPHLLAGFLCLAMMTPLAITSTNAMIKRLGGKRWRRLHRLVYPAAMLAAAHYLLLVKSDISAPGGYILILIILFYARMVRLSRTASGDQAAAR